MDERFTFLVWDNLVRPAVVSRKKVLQQKSRGRIEHDHQYEDDGRRD